MKIVLSRAGSSLSCPLTQQLLRIMKLTGMLILITCLHVSANGIGQNVTLSVKDAPLQQVFTEIIRQSGTSIIYNNISIKNAKPVTIEVKNATVNQVLELCLKGQPFSFAKEKGFIIVKSVESVPTLDFTAPPVTGIVRGPDGQPIAGANILIKGTTRGTTTNINGSFSINAVNGETLVISSIGFGEKQQIINNENIGIIILALSESKLDEVQIIAYGQTSQRLATGNVTSVKAKDIEKSPVGNPLLALSGRVPGVFINQSTGISGTGVNINIQGINSIINGNSPFYVIDGIPYTSQLLPTLQGVLGEPARVFNSDQPGSGNPLSYINPGEIESIEILKDADATAIYGSRAANGAILITTKRGKGGKTNVDFSAQRGVGQVAKKMKMLNTQQYLEMRREAYTNDHQEIPTSPHPYIAPDLTVFDQNRYTDWQEKLIGGTANITNLQGSISGGSNSTTFRLNGTYRKETTVFPANFSDVKGSVGVNINHASSDNRFKLQFSANLLNDNNQLPPSDLTAAALSLPPNAPALYTSDGRINWQPILFGTDSASTWANPIAGYKETYKVNSNNLVSGLNLSYTILKELIFKVNIGYTNLITKEINTSPKSAQQLESQKYSDNVAYYSNGRIQSWIAEPQLTYDFNINKGHADLLLGTTFQETNKELMKIKGVGFSTEESMVDYSSAAALTNNPSVLSKYRYNALFGRLNYNWVNKYILNFTLRRDGSSRFGPANQFHNFGAVGAAWIFSNEEFINKLSFLSFGKLRGSYGTTGNDQIGDYGYLNQYTPIPGYLAPSPYQGIVGKQPVSLSNPYIQWESTKKLQVGLDLGFFSDRLLFGLNYYDNRSSNQLIGYALGSQAGFSAITRNLPATVLNRGLEAIITSTNIKRKEIVWSTSLNLTVSGNKLVAFPNISQSAYANTLVVGQPVNVIKVFNFAGVNDQTGVSQFYDIDGKITVNPNSLTDKTVFINPSPTFYGGLQNSFSYKGFDIDFLFQFVKQKRQNYKLGTTFQLGAFAWNEPAEVLKRWQKPGDNTDVQRFSVNEYLFNVGSSSLLYSDASYVRLKNIAISWNLPTTWTQRAKIERCRLFTQGQNIFTITRYKGLDPENSTNLSLPPLRVITFGIQVTL
jgi:TonB-dependent starch-binding outer membrane protein SusC